MPEPQLASPRPLIPTRQEAPPVFDGANAFVRDANALMNTLLSIAEDRDDEPLVRYPVDAYTMLSGLELLANRERRLLLGLTRALTILHRGDRIVMDADAGQPNPTRAVDAALSAIALASDLLTALEAAFDEARQPLAGAALRVDAASRPGVRR